MSKDHLILAVNFDPEKFPADFFPVALTEKLDGIAGRFSYTAALEKVINLTRQNETLHSVGHIEHWLLHKLPVQRELLGELYIRGLPFQEVSGIIRREVGDERIHLHIYDYVLLDQPDATYEQRMEACIKEIGQYMTDPARPVWFMPTAIVHNMEGILVAVQALRAENPKAEGLMIRPIHHEVSKYRVGRSKGFIRWKPKPTIDLRVHSYLEATNLKTGAGLGMVGRINLHYKGGIIGCGPGRMTHDERKSAWLDQGRDEGRMCEVQYMQDDDYSALRQPTWQRWRDDKDTPDA